MGYTYKLVPMVEIKCDHGNNILVFSYNIDGLNKIIRSALRFCFKFGLVPGVRPIGPNKDFPFFLSFFKSIDSNPSLLIYV